MKNTRRKKITRKQIELKVRKEDKIRNIILELEKENIAPAKNYLRNLLPKETKRTKLSTELSARFRKESIQDTTIAEKVFGKVLKKLNIKYEFQKIVHYEKGKWYMIDFYIPIKRIAIEIDGGYHNLPEQMEKDKIRTTHLEKLKVKVIRFTNNEVFSKTIENKILLSIDIP